MSQQPTLEEQELLAETLRRVRQRIPARESAAEILVAIGFVLAAVAIWLIDPPRWWAWAPALLCSVVLVLAIRVRFDTPFGFTGATQLGFVPLLFALPVAAVPFVVAAALLVALLPEVVGGEVRAGRLLFCFGNAWFAIGPAAVFALSGTSPRHAGAGLLLAALAAQFALDFAVSTLRFADREAGLFVQVRETWVYANDAALSAIAILVAQDVGRTPLAALAPLPLLGLLAVFARERHRRIESLIELNEAYRGTALVLGDVVAADDGYTGEHSRGVVALALELGARLGLDAQQRRNLEFGALLHDVGKIAIPKEIINKPGTLDPREWQIITTHTLEGQKMLDRVGGFMRDVGLIIRSHHERWDGTGYPDRLAGGMIPLEARIIACCDAWNAMRTDRVYRRAMSYAAARAELAAHSGRQFDPRVAAALLEMLDAAERDRRARSVDPPSTPSAAAHGAHGGDARVTARTAFPGPPRPARAATRA